MPRFAAGTGSRRRRVPDAHHPRPIGGRILVRRNSRGLPHHPPHLPRPLFLQLPRPTHRNQKGGRAQPTRRTAGNPTTQRRFRRGVGVRHDLPKGRQGQRQIAVQRLRTTVETRERRGQRGDQGCVGTDPRDAEGSDAVRQVGFGGRAGPGGKYLRAQFGGFDGGAGAAFGVFGVDEWQQGQQELVFCLAQGGGEERDADRSGCRVGRELRRDAPGRYRDCQVLHARGVRGAEDQVVGKDERPSRSVDVRTSRDQCDSIWIYQSAKDTVGFCWVGGEYCQAICVCSADCAFVCAE
mmetsp:Transcript_46111/g.96834  ORF Transcript_46111/g.96834 Transcript_46111/m.96834 type:complete len:295 (-) Transcript_46111:868-1752(-)